MTRMVLSVAYPFAAVGAGAVGGAETILTSLEGALVGRGWGSVVVARSGSVCAGRLLATAVPKGVITEEVREEVLRRHQAGIDRALATERIDVVHMHGIDFDRYRLPEGMPVLVTLHLPPSWYPEGIWALPVNYRLVCVSGTQRAACPTGPRERLTVVENGVELPEMERLSPRRKYAVIMSRICPEKNLHAGIDAARAAGVPVVLAGEVFPYAEHLRYFREEIEPRLRDGVRFVGGGGGAEKTRLLARSRCLLLPTLAPETSSLVAMEAMAVGTPVVGYRSGAVPEVVEEGRTGFLVRDVAEMASAIGRAGEIDPEVCRRVAGERFSLERMVGGYVGLYQEMCGGGREGSAGVAGDDGRTAAESGDVGAAEVAAAEVLTCTVLRDMGELEAVEAEWKGLWEADGRTTPFQSPEWLLPWWRWVGEGELFAVVARAGDGRMVGLLPMYVYTQPEGGERHLLLLGAGTSDYLDGLFAGTDAEAERVAGVMLEDLGRYAGLWDRGYLHQVRKGSPLLGWARRTGKEVFGAEPCAVVAVEGRERLPAKLRLNSGRYLRRAEARGEVTFAVAESGVEAVGAFEDLVVLHGRRWEGGGVLAPRAVQEQHRECVPKLLGAGLLWMLMVAVGGRRIGVLYALMDPETRVGGRRMYSYLVGFDPGYGELSPGTLLLSYAFDRCAREGVRWMDLLRGGEGYKRLWGAVEERTFGFEVAGVGASRLLGDR